jgi:hypothetical protein
MITCVKLLPTSLTVLTLMAAALPVMADPTPNPEPEKAKVGDDGPAVYLLVDDRAVLGFGHAALLVGDGNGWDYYSFGPNASDNPQKDNLIHLHFKSFSDARSSKDLARYDEELCWNASDEHRTEAVRVRVLKAWDKSNYNAISRNCFQMAADGLKAGSFDIDGNFVAPVSAYKANEGKATSHGAWPVSEP